MPFSGAGRSQECRVRIYRRRVRIQCCEAQPRARHGPCRVCSAGFIQGSLEFRAPASGPPLALGDMRVHTYDLDIICHSYHNIDVRWAVEMADEFKAEFDGLARDVRREILALARVLQEFGPQLGRPRVDTLQGSRHANMKELRFSAADGEWRVAFAFDPKRKAILLVAGDKSGGSEKRFYRGLMRKADERFDAHLARIERGT